MNTVQRSAFAGGLIAVACLFAGCTGTYEKRRAQDLATMQALIDAADEVYARWAGECEDDPDCLDRARTLQRNMHVIAVHWHLARASTDFRPNEAADLLQEALRTLQAMSIHDEQLLEVSTAPSSDEARPR